MKINVKWDQIKITNQLLTKMISKSANKYKKNIKYYKIFLQIRYNIIYFIIQCMEIENMKDHNA